MTRHVPILLKPLARALTEPLREGGALVSVSGYLVDCTLGGGGHAGALLEATASLAGRVKLFAIDRDATAVARAKERFARELSQGRLELHHARMSEVEPLLEGKPVLGLMADLGFSSDQIDDPERGLSFQYEGPLDMRLDPSGGMTARAFLAQSSEREIEAVLREYGEERFSKRIASAIFLAKRERKLPATTKELADLVARAVPPPARHGHGLRKIHPATRTFQALRIQVNEELKELEYLLGRVILKIQPGGRAAILSFHSLEDRLIKRAFKPQGVSEHPFRPVTKKPLEADEEEVRANPRARSAKLRIAERLG